MQQCVAAAGLALPKQELRGVDAVDRPVVRYMMGGSGEGGEGRVPVVAREDLVRDDSGRDLARAKRNGSFAGSDGVEVYSKKLGYQSGRPDLNRRPLDPQSRSGRRWTWLSVAQWALDQA